MTSLLLVSFVMSLCTQQLLTLASSTKKKVVKTHTTKTVKTPVSVHELVSKVVETHKDVQSLQPEAVQQVGRGCCTSPAV